MFCTYFYTENIFAKFQQQSFSFESSFSNIVPTLSAFQFLYNQAVKADRINKVCDWKKATVGRLVNMSVQCPRIQKYRVFFILLKVDWNFNLRFAIRLLYWLARYDTIFVDVNACNMSIKFQLSSPYGLWKCDVVQGWDQSNVTSYWSPLLIAWEPNVNI